MTRLTAPELMQVFLALSIAIGLARVLGEAARRIHQPAVVGELLAGILLGPTVLGAVAPAATAYLIPIHGSVSILLHGLSQLSVVLFLLVAGMEVEVAPLWSKGRSVTMVSLAGILVPFGLGLAAAPHLDDGHHSGPVFPLFLATVLSISALPVIARILMDLNLLQSDVGRTIMGAAVIDDLVGWSIFAAILGRLQGEDPSHDLLLPLLGTSLFALAMLTVGRRLIDRAFQSSALERGGASAALTFVLILTLVAAAVTEFLGSHGIFGAFLVGVAVGNSPYLVKEIRESLSLFVYAFLVPLFFVRIGLQVNFVQHFDGGLVLAVLVLACVGKLIGCGTAARATGASWPVAWAIGFGMNARGAMAIILGTLALQNRVIAEPMFVAIVLMALITSVMSGPAMRALLARP